MTSTYTHPGQGVWTLEVVSNLPGWRFFPSTGESDYRHLAMRNDGLEQPVCGAQMDDTPLAGREYDMIVGQHSGDGYCSNCQRVYAKLVKLVTE